MKNIKLSILAIALIAGVNVNAQDKTTADHEKKFKKIDANSDGFVTLEELQNFKDEKGTEDKEERDQAARFAKMDQDADGQVSLSEYLDHKNAVEKKKIEKKARIEKSVPIETIEK